MLARRLAVFVGLLAGCDRGGGGASPALSAPPSAATSASEPAAADPSPGASAPPAPGAEEAPPAAPGALDEADARRIDAAVRGAIDRGEVPGAVVLVVAGDRVVFHRAYGLRSKEPEARPMRAGTLFDLASLTKPVATATSVLLLAAQGELRLSDPVATHLPAFAANGKAAVTIEQLLLHTSGLPADNPLPEYTGDRAAMIGRVLASPLRSAPGDVYTYSDVGYIVLGELVAQVGGRSARAASADGPPAVAGGLGAFAKARIFDPLGMARTGFSPGPALAGDVAATERLGDRVLAGTVHDPRARALGGEAGHAGLFSTAEDLGRFARMLLAGGTIDGAGAPPAAASGAGAPAAATPGTSGAGAPPPAASGAGTPAAAPPATSGAGAPAWTRVLDESVVRELLRPRPIPGGQRAYLGAVSGGAVSHTGFTGTLLWVDRGRRIAVVVLSNRVHPDGKGSADRLRREVLEVAVAGASNALRAPSRGAVKVGIDVLADGGFAELRGRSVALLTHAAGRTRAGRSTIDALRAAKEVKLVALLSPEHGLRSSEEGAVGDGRDAATGLPVHSLYGAARRPSRAMLEGADTIVVDLQDAGARFYTYSTTLGYTLEAAAEMGVRVVVLDRPNPLGGSKIEGPLLDAGKESFVGYHRVPVRHGMTLGELARMFTSERAIQVDLAVIPAKGWTRDMLYPDTGLAWTAPSPNLRNPSAALLYPGLGLLEMTNVSVGRGTLRPFEHLGAPWIDGARLAAALRGAGARGVTFAETTFTPSASVFRGEVCHGVALGITSPGEVDSVRLGLALAVTLRRLFPAQWKPGGLGALLGHERALAAITAGEPLGRVLATFEPETATFAARREPFLLY